MARFRFKKVKEKVRDVGRKVAAPAAKGAGVLLPAIGAFFGGTAGAGGGALAATAFSRYAGAAGARGKGLKGTEARAVGRKRMASSLKTGAAITGGVGIVQTLLGQNLASGIFGSRSPAPNPQTSASESVVAGTNASVGRASAAEGGGLLGQALDFLGLGKPDAQQSPAKSNVPLSEDMFGPGIPLNVNPETGETMEPDVLSPSTWPAWYWIAAAVVVAGGAAAIGVI